MDVLDFIELDGFTEIVIHTGPETFIFVTLHCVGGEGDDCGLIGQGGAADQPCGFEAIHLRHLEVHQDDIKSVGGGGGLCGKLAAASKGPVTKEAVPTGPMPTGPAPTAATKGQGTKKVAAYGIKIINRYITTTSIGPIRSDWRLETSSILHHHILSRSPMIVTKSYVVALNPAVA